MRINVYQEELTDEVEIVERHVEETGKTYIGVRFFLKSPEELHDTAEDDDRSAVTFWCGTVDRAHVLMATALDEVDFYAVKKVK